MDVHILTIFPAMFASPLQASILQRAQERQQLRVTVHDLRDFASGRHRVTDDSPYGGGAGMVMKPEPIVTGIQALQAHFGPAYVILMSPQGRVLDQAFAKTLLDHPCVVLVCGRYSGVDARVLKYIDAELSIGDYVLTGGELPAMVLLDVVGRMIPGVVGDRQSVEEDSFQRSAAGTAVHATGNLRRRPRAGCLAVRGPRRDCPVAAPAGPADNVAEAPGSVEARPSDVSGPSHLAGYGRRRNGLACAMMTALSCSSRCCIFRYTTRAARWSPPR